MRGESLTYNLSNGRGKVQHGTTKMEDGYYRGDEIRNRADTILLVDRGIYTTCDRIEDPHFHFGSRRMKMIMNDLIIARPIILYLGGIPFLDCRSPSSPIRAASVIQDGSCRPMARTRRKDGI